MNNFFMANFEENKANASDGVGGGNASDGFFGDGFADFGSFQAETSFDNTAARSNSTEDANGFANFADFPADGFESTNTAEAAESTEEV